jgi:hypothetical protein
MFKRKTKEMPKDCQPMDSVAMVGRYEPPSKTIIKLRDGGYWYIDNTFEEFSDHIKMLWEKFPLDFDDCIIAVNVVGYDEEMVAFKYSELTSIIKLKDRRGNETD